MKTLLLTLLAAVLFGCTACSTETPTETTSPEPEILTHVYRGTPLEMPEGFTLCTASTPYYDAETGDFTFLSIGSSERSLATYHADGTWTSEETVAPELMAQETLTRGLVMEDYILFQTYHVNYDPSQSVSGEIPKHAYLLRYDRATGETVRGVDIRATLTDEFADSREYSLVGMAVDADGYIYFAGENELLVFNPDLTLFGQIATPGWINCIRQTFDGRVTLWGTFSQGVGYYEIDPETRLPEKSALQTTAELDKHYYAPDGTLYYIETDGDRAWYYTLSSDGTPELLMDYTNSSLESDGFVVCQPLDRDTFIGAATQRFTGSHVPALYQKADDIVVADLKIIDYASLGAKDNGMDDEIRSRIVEYNRSQFEYRIVITDYSQYDDPEARLMLDITNKSYLPDIVDSYPESTVMRYLVENELYVDIKPYLVNGTDLRYDDLFGAVQRMFDDDGRMWGIAPKFTFSTAFGPTEKLGDRAFWTLDELMDYAESLPEDEQLMMSLLPHKAEESLLGPMGYRYFMDLDAGTASFDSPTFLRYLNFIKNLPNNYDYYYDNFASSYNKACQTGRISLSEVLHVSGLSTWIEMESRFTTEDLNLIGYPAQDDRSSHYATAEHAYMITSYAEEPDVVWDALLQLLPSPLGNMSYYMISGLPAFKTMYNTLAEYNYDMIYVHKLVSGGTIGHTYDPNEPPETPEKYGEPIYVARFDEEEAARLYDFLDQEIGLSVLDTLPDDLNAIVREEVSRYLSGMGTAEDCANVVQSRVTIWLAEHSK